MQSISATVSRPSIEGQYSFSAAGTIIGSGLAEREGGCISFILQVLRVGKLSSTAKVTQEYAGQILQHSRILGCCIGIIYLLSRR